MKNILLAITGASPQVVTETLYALHVEGKTFPDEMIVITTSGSKDMLMEGFFTNGHLAALQQEYDMPAFKFDESNIWLIEDDQGNALDDAKSIEDQTYMADFITRKVFELTQDNNIAIHASIAGGRKTMAFYLGYAMSLLGRPQDSLSHVFVNDEFEFVKDFYYPTKTTNIITGKFGKGELDTSQAQVTLAEIPFVRMRQAVEPQLINSMGNMSFSQTVTTLNSSYSDQLSVELYLKSKRLSISGDDIKLTAKELAFYLWLSDLTASDNKGLIVSVDERIFDNNKAHAISFLQQFMQISTDPRVFKSTFGIEPEDFKIEDYTRLRSMNKEFIQTTCSSINKKLKKFPSELATKVDIGSITQQAACESQLYSVNAIINDIKININA